MSLTVRFHETLRRLAMIDEGFVEGEARLGLDLAGTPALDSKTAALLQVGVSVAIGSPSDPQLRRSHARKQRSTATRTDPASG